MLFVLSVLSILPINASKSDKIPAITMVSYEQSWLDYEGTLALKNNTNENVYNVAFRLTYFDLSGNQLDYADFTRTVDIAPGMTRKINVPSYEHNRRYHYYKTKDEFNNPAFKIDFKLNDYNRQIIAEDDSPEYHEDYDVSRNTTPMILLSVFAGIMALSIVVGLYVLVAVMAQKRNRSVVAWLFLSIIATPLLIVIILLIIGDAEGREF